MAGFWFTVADVFPADEGWGRGIFVVGPPSETSGGLSIGDSVLIPVEGGGEHLTQCLGLPLLNLGRDRLRWVTLHIALPDRLRVRVSGRAAKIEPHHA